MPRSNDRRSKQDSVEEEFLFLERILTKKALEEVFANSAGGFFVRRMKEINLFEVVGKHGGMASQTWVAYGPDNVPPNYAKRLPEGNEVWEVFPYDEIYLNGIGPHSQIVAVVEVHMSPRTGEPAEVWVRKMPTKCGWHEFHNCLRNIRRIAGWSRWKVSNQPPHPDNVKF